MKRRTLITTAVVGALSLGMLTATPVLAKDRGYEGDHGRYQTRFDRMDLNDDGKITKREARRAKRQYRDHDRNWNRDGRGRYNARFDRMDLNNDGTVTKREARRAKRQYRDQHWNRGDRDNRHARFDRAGLNNDGTVTRREARKARRQIHDEGRK